MIIQVRNIGGLIKVVMVELVRNAWIWDIFYFIFYFYFGGIWDYIESKTNRLANDLGGGV